MIAATHLAVGAAVGLWGARLVNGVVNFESDLAQTFVRVSTAFILATFSHMVLDAIPHNDEIYRTSHGLTLVLGTELAITFSSIFLIVYLRNLNLLIILSSLAGAAWMDVLSKIGLPILAHDNFHTLCRPEMGGSLIIQLLIAIIALFCLF